MLFGSGSHFEVPLLSLTDCTPARSSLKVSPPLSSGSAPSTVRPSLARDPRVLPGWLAISLGFWSGRACCCITHKNPPTPCLWQAPASAQKPKGKPGRPFVGAHGGGSRGATRPGFTARQLFRSESGSASSAWSQHFPTGVHWSQAFRSEAARSQRFSAGAGHSARSQRGFSASEPERRTGAGL